MSKAKDAMRYALENEDRFRKLTGGQQLGELKRLREARSKLAVMQAKAELALEQVDEFKAAAGAKAAVKLMEAHIEGTLLLIDAYAQAELPIGQVMEAMMGHGPAGTMPLVNQETGEIVSEVRRP